MKLCCSRIHLISMLSIFSFSNYSIDAIIKMHKTFLFCLCWLWWLCSLTKLGRYPRRSSMSAPMAISNAITSAWPFSAAINNAVFPTYIQIHGSIQLHMKIHTVHTHTPYMYTYSTNTTTYTHTHTLDTSKYVAAKTTTKYKQIITITHLHSTHPPQLLHCATPSTPACNTQQQVQPLQNQHQHYSEV